MRLFVLSAALAVALTACNRVTPEEAGAVNLDPEAGNSIVDVTSGDGKGQVTLNLPGGIGASVSVPTEIMDGAHMEIDGVGLYPGGKIGRLNVKDQGAGGLVAIAFSAPADPATVADWYEKQFAAQQRVVARTGTTLTGVTEDGDPFTLVITADGSGARGVMTTKDKDKG